MSTSPTGIVEVDEPCWKWDAKSISSDMSNLPLRYSSLNDGRGASYAFDNVFGPEHSNYHVYCDVVKPIVDRVIQGTSAFHL